MCELNNLDQSFTARDNDQTIARFVANKWLKYFKQLFVDGISQADKNFQKR